MAGRYRLLEVVHRETNRVAWYGEEARSDRPCLLTRIALPADGGGGTAHRATGRVTRTSEAVRALCPGQVPETVDAFEEAGALWTVTAWPGGTPLTALLAQSGPLPPERAARLGLELLDVLEAAHGAGVTHGELSPGQVLVPDQGPAVVCGFGLAGATLGPRLTAPSYAAPEQARDERIGPSCDLWALGALLYTMVEGRPPFRDRDQDRPEVTLRGVDRLPLRAPLRAGPLTQVVHGLLRKDSRERLTRRVTREALLRVLSAAPGAAPPEGPGPRPRPAAVDELPVRPRRGSRTTVLSGVLALVTVAVILVAAKGQGDPEGVGATAPAAPPRASPSAPAPSSPPAPPAPAPAPPSASAAPSPTGRLPAGFRTFTAPEGFSLAVPDGWTALGTKRMADLAYRVVLGAPGDPRTLTVTYSKRVGPDPVAVWRDDVEPGLKRADGYRRLGGILATTYRGRAAADIQWLADVDGIRERTFGRGVSAGAGLGYSLRWTTPAADWRDRANREALDTALRTFRPPVL
ncbi:serine/threonine-protein kinase [Streptomyces sp. NPDC091377]|uniref:serine/threonine-protein kinase n=1 Tax=Streptomyces sp. NPDC091377 TaxID=3365995 RepID=UPI00381F31E8